MRWLPVACLLMAVSALARAEPAADWTYPVTYQGKPVVGAKVELVPITYVTPREPKAGKPVFATTDDKGEVRFPKPADLPSLNHIRALARDAAGTAASTAKT